MVVYVTVQYVMVGLTRACWPRCPEWDIEHSIRYHSNDGGVFNGGLNHRSGITFTKGQGQGGGGGGGGGWRVVVWSVVECSALSCSVGYCS